MRWTPPDLPFVPRLPPQVWKAAGGGLA
jgi:hypothetical protein